MTSEEIQYFRTFSDKQIYFEPYDYGEPGLWLDVLDSNFSDYFVVLNINKSSIEPVRTTIMDELFKNDSEILAQMKIRNVTLRKIISYPVFDCDKNEDELSFNYNLSLELCHILHVFWRIFHYIPIFKHDVSYAVMCPGENGYFDIVLGKSFNEKTLQFFYTIKNESFNYEEFKQEKFLQIGYQEPRDLWKSLKPGTILPSNTKARRLRYLCLILDSFEESDYYPLNYFPRQVEKKAEKINPFLSSYVNSKGIIKVSKTGISAQPYINLSENLSLLTQLNRTYILTKQSKVYKVLKAQLKRNIEEFIPQVDMFNYYPLFTKDNPFELTIFEKSFILHQILLKDTLYFWALIEIVRIQEGSWLEEIKQEFQQYILNELERQLDSSKMDIYDLPNADRIIRTLHLPNLDKKKILQISQRIRKWQKPDKYLPHIIEPRINWFLDLNLLDPEAFKQKSCKLSKSGTKLFEILATFYDIFLEKSTIIDFIIQNYYFQIVNATYDLNCKRYTQEEFSGQLENYIEESFKYFKTMAPNNISAYQAIYYTCYKFLLKDKRIIEFVEVKNFLENKQNTKFTLDWYPKEHDGSLQKRR